MNGDLISHIEEGEESVSVQSIERGGEGMCRRRSAELTEG